MARAKVDLRGKRMRCCPLHADPASAQLIGFDMGGTSTDVSRYAGSMEHVFETTTAGISVQAPQLDINTVAAGGGSMLKFSQGGIFLVGPESVRPTCLSGHPTSDVAPDVVARIPAQVGAHPGPVCYRKDGSLAITDANLQLGRIIPDSFPKIFGPEEVRKGTWLGSARSV